MDCPPGYFYNNVTSNCEVCLKGSYTSEPRQLQCQSCPPNTTTRAPGSNNSADCFRKFFWSFFPLSVTEHIINRVVFVFLCYIFHFKKKILLNEKAPKKAEVF